MLTAVSTGSTIPDKGLFTVRTEDGVKLGELDEEFVFEARVGDKFLLGSFAWQIRDIRKDTVIVGQSSSWRRQSRLWKVRSGVTGNRDRIRLRRDPSEAGQGA